MDLQIAFCMVRRTRSVSFVHSAKSFLMPHVSGHCVLALVVCPRQVFMCLVNLLGASFAILGARLMPQVGPSAAQHSWSFFWVRSPMDTAQHGAWGSPGEH